jgi:hypothetical protein
MDKINGLPVYRMKPGLGVDFHSLVTDPAIEVLFKTFGKEKKYIFNKEKQIVTGPFMIPDLPIYRSDLSHGEYYVIFDKETVLEMNEMFMKEQKTLSFNYQHQDNSKVEGAVLVENWIVQEGDNKAKNLGFNVPVGTWMGSVKINNKEFWEKEIKSGNVRGFSIEGYLEMEMKKQTKMTKKTMKLSVTAKTKDGSYTLATEAEAWAEGVDVYTVTEDGTQSTAKDGEYTLDNGTVITVASGKVTKVVEVAAEEQMSDEEVKVIIDALGLSNVVKELGEIKAELASLKEKFAKLPGSVSVTDADDTEAGKGGSKKETVMEKVTKLKSILNKK